jgi:hypothetical protein
MWLYGLKLKTLVLGLKGRPFAIKAEAMPNVNFADDCGLGEVWKARRDWNCGKFLRCREGIGHGTEGLLALHRMIREGNV